MVALRIAFGLGLLYVLTLASTDPVDLAIGTGIGLVLTGVLGRRLRLGPVGEMPPFARRAAGLPVFLGAVLADILRGTWVVTLNVLGVRELQPGIVRVPIGERTERGVAVSALATTLSPGSVLVDLDRERGDMLLHVIDASDPEAVRADHLRMYERYQRRVFH